MKMKYSFVWIHLKKNKFLLKIPQKKKNNNFLNKLKRNIFCQSKCSLNLKCKYHFYYREEILTLREEPAEILFENLENEE